MLDDLQEQISDFVADEQRDLKFKAGDKVLSVLEDASLFISYDYLLSDDSKYSFLNDEFHNKLSEEFPNLSDYQIYFNKLKSICSLSYSAAEQDSLNFKTVSLNKNLKEILYKIYDKDNLRPEEIPSIIELRLYTNKNSDRAPRIFGFLGHANVIYIFAYDPFHDIFNAMSKN